MQKETTVASVVNLNRFRKAKKRDEAQRQAAENRVLSGRTKAERQQRAKEQDRAQRELDSKRLD
jgi:hypothetical protein